MDRGVPYHIDIPGSHAVFLEKIATTRFPSARSLDICGTSRFGVRTCSLRILERMLMRIAESKLHGRGGGGGGGAAAADVMVIWAALRCDPC